MRYKVPLLRDGERVWVEVEEYDTGRGIVDWEGDYFVSIMEEYLAAGHGRTGTVGAARSYLFDAAALLRFAVAWMERRLGGQGLTAREAPGTPGP